MASYKEVVTPSSSSLSSELFTGRVKWFNNKAGYGFITVTDGSRAGTDVFAHHTAISVANQQYKYLVQGEYVEFRMSSTQSGKHEFQAANISGIKSGQLMCETRRDLNELRTSYNSTKKESVNQAEKSNVEENAPRPKSLVKRTAVKERPSNSSNPEWSLVKNTEQKKPRGRPPRKN